MFSMCNYDWSNHYLKTSTHPLAGANYLSLARKLKETGLDNGIVCNQSHAPFPSNAPGIQSYLKRAIECTAEAGGNICVIHPINNGTLQENKNMYQKLLPFAKECGVKIATENMWNWDEEKDHACFAACATPESFVALLDIVDDPSFIACLDIGHAEMHGCNTSAVEMIDALDNRLQALHIHDNDRRYDLHQIPFSMGIDFMPIVQALKKINYDGYFTLESSGYLGQYSEQNIHMGYCALAESVKKLAAWYDM